MNSLLRDDGLKKAIAQIVVRTEYDDLKTAVDSFYDCNIISHLTNSNHQIIQGRRGTGKTHILRVLQKTMETTTQHCIYFDCRGTGTSKEISSSNIPEKYRAIQLIRTFLLRVYKDLSRYYKEIKIFDGSNETSQKVQNLLSIMFSECYSVNNTKEKFERAKTNTNRTRHRSLLSSLLQPATDFDARQQKASGVSFGEIVYPNVKDCLTELTTVTGKNFIILIDEWSSLPWELQPHFSEFLHQCFFSSNCFTIKIAAVKNRSQYSIRKNSVVYGLELGADISADFDLDQIYALDGNPRKIFSDLFSILWTHLKANGIIQNIDVVGLANGLFVSFQAAALIVRASEGNPRDFISILHQCLIQSDGMGNSATKINCHTVYAAANLWYKDDKCAALAPEQRKLLDELTMFVVHEHNNRAFLLEERYLQSKQIAGLIDARVLHPIQTRRFFPDLCRRPLAILVLDFGTYSPELETGKDIHFYASDTDDEIETYIFGKYGSSRYDDALYPLDATRKFRRCYWDPEYLNYPLE